MESKSTSQNINIQDQQLSTNRIGLLKINQL